PDLGTAGRRPAQVAPPGHGVGLGERGELFGENDELVLGGDRQADGGEVAGHGVSRCSSGSAPPHPSLGPRRHLSRRFPDRLAGSWRTPALTSASGPARPVAASRWGAPGGRPSDTTAGPRPGPPPRPG